MSGRPRSRWTLRRLMALCPHRLAFDGFSATLTPTDCAGDEEAENDTSSPRGARDGGWMETPGPVALD